MLLHCSCDRVLAASNLATYFLELFLFFADLISVKLAPHGTKEFTQRKNCTFVPDDKLLRNANNPSSCMLNVSISV
jgi:hypothetical protein